MYTRFASAVATTAAITVLAACSNTKAERAAARDSSAAPASAGAPATTAGANVVTVTAKEYSYDAPAEIPAGLTTIRLVSAGKEVHHVSLIKLEDGKTIQDFAAAMKTPGPFPSWAVELGGPNPPHPDGGVAEARVLLERRRPRRARRGAQPALAERVARRAVRVDRRPLGPHRRRRR